MGQKDLDKMKTAEEYLKIWQGEEVVISEDIAIVAMKEYAKQVAEQALKDAASELNDDDFISDEGYERNKENILSGFIKLP